jgi:hypothetical protein
MTQATSDQSITTTITVAASPEQAYAAINNPRGWWSQTITGVTDEVGAEWEYRVDGIHYSKIRVEQLVPGERVVWRVVEAWLSFIDDTTEWNDTEIRFDIWQDADGTKVRFTHVGITPEVECYEICNVAWGSYVGNSLNGLIETGVGNPNQEREGGSQEGQAQEALRRAAERTA